MHITHRSQNIFLFSTFSLPIFTISLYFFSLPNPHNNNTVLCMNNCKICFKTFFHPFLSFFFRFSVLIQLKKQLFCYFLREKRWNTHKKPRRKYTKIKLLFHMFHTVVIIVLNNVLFNKGFLLKIYDQLDECMWIKNQTITKREN